MRLTNKILARSCKQARFDKPAHNSWLCEQMLEFMHSQDAIGLAANQIGRDIRLFVMSVSGVTRCCFNPEITDSGSNTVKMAEGCLSFKGNQCILQRPNDITVRYQDHSGVWIQDRLIGLESRCFQHELDHLNGITMWDRQKEQHAEQSGN